MGRRCVRPPLVASAPDQHHAVLLPRRALAHLALKHVQRDQLGLAIEGIAPASAASRLDPHQRARGNRLVVDETRQDALAWSARIHGDAEWRPGLSAAKSPAREDRAIGDAEERAVAKHAELLEVAESSAPGSWAARVRR